MPLSYANYVTDYLSRIQIVQDSVHADLEGLLRMVDDILAWNTNLDMQTDTRWQDMERTLNHIERTYQRL